MRTIVTFFLMTVSLYVNAIDSFDDGNFTGNPVWNGSTGDWQIVTSSDVATGAANSNTLRLNVPSGGGISYLTTPIQTAGGETTQWAFFVGRRAQAYTSSNYALIWLWASEQNLTSPTVDGYRIRIGDDSDGDEIVLQRVTDGVATDILVGPALTNGLTDVGFTVRIIRARETWYLYTSPLPVVNGTGAVATTNPEAAMEYQGTVIDDAYTPNNPGYFGFASVYTSGTNARAAQEFDQLMMVTTLPVTLERFNAFKAGTGVSLAWDVSEESYVQAYEVQRSENGIQFTPIGSVNAAAKRTYSFIDAQPGSLYRFYRLRMVDLDGNSKLSHIVSVTGKAALNMRASPNPARTIVNVMHPKAKARSSLQVINAEGRIVKQMIVPENAVLTTVDFSGLQNGMYYLVFFNDKEKISGMILKQ